MRDGRSGVAYISDLLTLFDGLCVPVHYPCSLFMFVRLLLLTRVVSSSTNIQASPARGTLKLCPSLSYP